MIYIYIYLLFKKLQRKGAIKADIVEEFPPTCTRCAALLLLFNKLRCYWLSPALLLTRVEHQSNSQQG